MQLNSYIHLNGTCAEAFRFYQQVLGGEITAMMTWAEGPDGASPPGVDGQHIMHASLQVDGHTLMGCDEASAEPWAGIRNSTLCINVDDVSDAERLFEQLSAGGNITLPLEETFWATRFGMFSDRYGVPWMINCSEEPCTEENI